MLIAEQVSANSLINLENEIDVLAFRLVMIVDDSNYFCFTIQIEMVSMISVLLAVIGVVAVALVNVQQAALMGEISTLKSRIAASDISQSSICASVSL